MAIALVTAGNAASSLLGGPTITLPLPASLAVGNILTMHLNGKYPTNLPTTPTGWIAVTPATGGSGSNGAGSGSTYAAAYIRIVDQALIDSGVTTVVVTVGTVPTGLICRGRIFQYSKGAATQWAVASVGGPRNTPSTAWSVTFPTDPDIKSGDMALVQSAINENSAITYGTPTLTVPGATHGTVSARDVTGTTVGDDVTQNIQQYLFSAGQSTGVATTTLTASAATGTAPAGATLLLRLREATNQTAALTVDGQNTISLSGSSDTPGILSIPITQDQSFSGLSDSSGSLTILGAGEQSFTGVSDSSSSLLLSTTGGLSLDGSVNSLSSLDVDVACQVSLAGMLATMGQLSIECGLVLEESPGAGFLFLSARGTTDFSEQDKRPLRGGGVIGAIRSFRTGSDEDPPYWYRVLRRQSGSIDDQGEYVPTVAGEFLIEACVQPVRGRDLQPNPEGESSDEEKIVFCTEKLMPRTPARDGDVVWIKGEPYEVDRSEEWEGPSDTHYEVTVSRTTIP
jgi:hypothetical protein